MATVAHQIAPALRPVEGAGSENFPWATLLATVVGVPAAAAVLLGAGLAGFVPLLLVLGLPAFAAFHYVHAASAAPIRPPPDRKSPPAPPSAFLAFNDPALERIYATNKIPIELFFEAYFDQRIDIRGDMLETLEARHDWVAFVWTLSQVRFFLAQWVPETLWHSRKQDENQVRDHYDRGNDFYSWFLGPMMIYTSGILSKPAGTAESLEEIQQRKLDTVLRKINLKPGERVLDIGCGWATLSVHAAKAGEAASVTGVTLSRNQIEWGNAKAKEAGVSDKVRLLCMDYRDIPFEKYDKIVCLEMAEHVGVLRFQTFLRQVREMLEDNGVFFLQIAGLRRAWQYEDLMWGLFMAKYVFPGADASCPLNWFVEQIERAGFEVQSVETLGLHYSATIYRWYLNWIGNKEKVVEKYGVRWFRIWEFFLAYSTIIARQGSATVYQLVCHKNLSSFDRSVFVKNRLPH